MNEARWVGEGEIGKLIQAHDWSQTPLGAVETWSESLKTAVQILGAELDRVNSSEKTQDSSELRTLDGIQSAHLRPINATHSFRAVLTEALRLLTDANEIQATAARILGEALGASRVIYIEVLPGSEAVVVHQHYTNGVQALSGQYRLQDFGRNLRADHPTGQTVEVPDVANSSKYTACEKARLLKIEIAAHLDVPLLKNHQFVALLVVHQATPRQWTDDEVSWVEETAEQTWAAVERARAEAALRQSEKRFRMLVSASSNVLYRMNADWSEMSELRGGNFIVDTVEPSRDWLQKYIHPDDQAQVLAEIEAAIQQKRLFELEHRVLSINGTLGWTYSRAVPLLDEAGEIVEWFGEARDITERKQIEAELGQKNAILNVINEFTPSPIYVKDRAGRIVFANPATLDVLGKSASEVIGYRDDEIYPGLGAVIVETDQRIMRTGEPETIEESIDGIRTFLSIKVPYRDETGAVIGLVGVSSDISDRIQLEREREQLLHQEQAAREASEQANRMKDEFLLVLSHELRTPLNPILGWIKLLKAGRLNPIQTQEALSIIERNAQIQTQLIGDLLDISCILQGKLALQQEPVNLAAVITAAQETVRLAAAAKTIVISTELEANVGPILGDAARLQQVVWNLLTNAIKFTPVGGQVRVRLARRGHQAQLQVIDTGKGIVPDFLPHVFERFRQSDSSTTRKFGGLGLGLAIVQQLVESHGGTIQAESLGEGKGATFTAYFPLLSEPSESLARATGALSPESETDHLLMGCEILLVDDDLDSREFVAFILAECGAVVVQADSAFEALALLSQMKFDVLISDIGMPEINGYDFIQQVRAKPANQGGRVLALALTAYADQTHATRAVQTGFEQHLAKPIDPDHLVASVFSLVNLQH